MAARSGSDTRGVNPAADLGLAAALLELQRAGYAVEADLIGDDRIPSLHEDVDALRGAGLYWLATFDGADPVAAVGWTESHGIVDIDRLVVAPRAHRRGLGSAWCVRWCRIEMAVRCWSRPAGTMRRSTFCRTV